MNVIYFCDADFKKNNNIGGHVSHVIGVIEALKALGYNVVIASQGNIPYLKMDEYEQILLPFPNIKYRKISALLWQREVINTIINSIPNIKPKFIYSRWPNNIFFKKIKKEYPGLPIILECNTPLTMNKKMKGVVKKINDRYQDKNNIDMASIISAVSDSVNKHLISHFNNVDNKVIINPNGVNIERFKPLVSNLRREYKIDDSVLVIGFSGHFHTWHRIDILIKAVQMLEFDFRLLIIGKGESWLETELKNLVQKKYIDKIIFTGLKPYDKIPEYLAICDILVVPQDKNRPHGSSIKLFEYMAMGKAIAAANVEQLAQVINHSDNGLLFEPNPDNLLVVLRRLAKDKNLRESLGARARQDVVSKYTWKENVSRILDALHASN